MIIDPHAHYSNNACKKPFRYMPYDKDGYTLKGGDREQFSRKLPDAIPKKEQEENINEKS